MNTSKQSYWESFLFILVNPKIRQNAIDFARAKIIINFVITLVLIGIAAGVWQIATGGVPVAIAIFVAAALMLLIPVSLKYVSSFTIPGIALSSLLYILITFIVTNNGGTLNFAISWYGMVFLLSFIVMGTLAGSIFGGLSVVTLIALFILEQNGSIKSFLTHNPMEPMLTTVFCLLAMTALLTAYSRMNRQFQDQLESTVRKVFEDEKAKEDILKDTSSVMASLSRGDLTKRISSELTGFRLLKTNINEALDMLGKTISKVMKVSDQVTSGANELLSGSQELSSGTTQQAASMEELSSSMNEIAAQAKTNNESAKQAQALSSKTTAGVTNGNEQMNLMMTSMEKINDTSSEISKVIKIIDEIAFQTNLLALNAAVEAARAGKYGKGFAVVAEEVRNLASRSADAAKSTTELIENAIREVSAGVENATKTAEMLTGIKDDIEKVNDFIGEISVSSREQVISVDEINSSIGQVNKVVQQNSAIADDSTAASRVLSNQADELQQVMQDFNLTDQPARLPASLSNSDREIQNRNRE